MTLGAAGTDAEIQSMLGEFSNAADTTPSSPDTGTHSIREALVQPSFSMGTVFRHVGSAGSIIPGLSNAFSRIYTGCKISRCTINLNEGQAVTVSVDFIAQDVRTNDIDNVPKNGDAIGVEMQQITEQPYFLF